MFVPLQQKLISVHATVIPLQQILSNGHETVVPSRQMPRNGHAMSCNRGKSRANAMQR
jgi:hypothetical protein